MRYIFKSKMSLSGDFVFQRLIWGRMASISTESAAASLGVSVRRVRAMILSGVLPAEKVGRDWIIKDADVEALKRQVRKRGRPPGSTRKT